MEGVIKNRRFSTNVSLYFENGKRYGQLQWQTNMKSHDLSIGAMFSDLEHYCKPNPVTPIFDAEYVQSGMRDD